MWQQIPVLEILPKSDRWQLFTSAVYYSSAYGEWYTVPAGFKTDLATIPRLFRWLIPVNGKHRCAAILHDYLYHLVVDNGKRMNKKKADLIFLEAMLFDKVPKYKAYPMYLAVKLFGGIALKK